jgi:hypothetical protein
MPKKIADYPSPTTAARVVLARQSGSSKKTTLQPFLPAAALNDFHFSTLIALPYPRPLGLLEAARLFQGLIPVCISSLLFCVCDKNVPQIPDN